MECKCKTRIVVLFIVTHFCPQRPQIGKRRARRVAYTMWLASLGSAAAPAGHGEVSFGSAMIEPLNAYDKANEPNWVKEAREIRARHNGGVMRATTLMQHPEGRSGRQLSYGSSMIEPMEATVDDDAPSFVKEAHALRAQRSSAGMHDTNLLQLEEGQREKVSFGSAMIQPMSLADDDNAPSWLREVKTLTARRGPAVMHAESMLAKTNATTAQKWSPHPAPVAPPPDELWASIQDDCGAGAENTSLASGLHLLHQLDPIKYDEFNGSSRMSTMLEYCKGDDMILNATQAADSQLGMSDLVNHVDCAWYWSTNVFGTGTQMKPYWWVETAVSRLQNLSQLQAEIEHDDDDLDAGDSLDSSDWAEKQARSMKVSELLIQNYRTAGEILLVAHRAQKVDDNRTSHALKYAKKHFAEIAKQADKRFSSARCKGGYDAKNCGHFRAISGAFVSGFFTARPSSHVDKAYIAKVVKILRQETVPFLLKEPMWDSNSREVAANVLTVLKVHNDTGTPKDHNTTLVPTTTLIPKSDLLLMGLETRLKKQTHHMVRASGCRRKIEHHVALMDGGYLAGRMRGFNELKLASKYVNGYTQAFITAGASGLVSEMLTSNTFTS